MVNTKKSYKLYVIVFGVILGLIVALIVKNNNRDNTLVEQSNVFQSQLGNMYNFGLYLEYNNHVYRMDYGDNLNDTFLVKENILTGESEVISEDAELCYFINEDVIYYSSKNNGGKLYTMDINGNNVKEFGDFRCEELMIFDENIYFISSDGELGLGLYKTDMDGLNRIQLYHGTIKNLNANKGYIYFLEKSKEANYIKKVDVKSLEVKEVIDYYITKFFILNNIIYGCNEGELFKINHTGEIEMIYQLDFDGMLLYSTMNVCNDLIIFSVHAPDGFTTGFTNSYNIKNGEIAEVYNENIKYSYIIDGKIITDDKGELFSINPYTKKIE